VSPHPLPTGPSSASHATAREFIAVLFRRKWIVLGLFAVTTATVLTIAFTTPVKYISSGRVLYKRGEQISVLIPDRRMTGDWEQELASEVELIQSAPVLDATRDLLRKEARPGLPAVKLDASQVDIEVMGKSNVIAIGYLDGDPDAAQRVCDALIRAYVDYRQKYMDVANPTGFFDTEIAAVDAQLDRLAEQRRVYANAHDIVDVGEQRRAMLQRLSVLEQQRSAVTTDLAEAAGNSRVMRDLQQRPDVDLPLPSNPVGTDLLHQLKQKVLDQEARLASLRERYREEAPEIVLARGTLDTLRGILRREVAMRLDVVDSRSRILQARLDGIDREIQSVQAELNGMPDKEARLAAIDRDIEVLKRRQLDLVMRADLARVNENTVSTSSVLLLSPAGPARPTNARDYVRLALAPAFALVVGIGLAFFLDGLDITVRTTRHAEEAAELPVLATLPERRRRRA
jgi:uncharacterized protein involved in exopolysaccharide biosynthesis